jgi:isoamylase
LVEVSMSVLPGRAYPLGSSFTTDGTNVAVFSEIAEVVEACFFDGDGSERRVALPAKTGHVFHGLFPDIGPGQRYGLRVQGPWDPGAGMRCNSAKLLLDPHATAVDGEISWSEAVFGHRFDDPGAPNDEDSAAAMPRCVVTDRSFDWSGDHPPGVPLDELVIYEAHVKGLTMRHPEIPADLRGTYKALAHPAVTGYLTGLGVTSVELMPVHQFVQDSHLLERGLRNYWGYNSICFLAPHGSYSSAGTSGGQVNEFKEMVKALHRAGLEVILDVVYNHTAEGNHLGPTLSMKGIDNPSYYRLVDDDLSSYFDTTGTGNSLNVGHPAALRLIIDSLRYWVTDMHVDGFRFDLATTLTRQTGDMDIQSAFLSLVHQDPVLVPVKLIAEPWDVAGYQVGGFPAPWSEWNGRYRDTVRDYWRGEEGTIGEFSLRLTGSGDIYAPERRPPTASINFVTAHDGFTLADLTSYNDKHNEANGEGNEDGENNNSSWNCGVEGPTDDPEVSALRARQRRNLLGSLLLSAGVPMILGGDEFGRTQHGNNNAYCQDNELSWFDWEHTDSDLIDFTRRALRLRRENPILRPARYLQGPEVVHAELAFFRADGKAMGEEDWRDPLNKALAVAFDGRPLKKRGPQSRMTTFGLVIVFNAHHEPVDFLLPPGRGRWEMALASTEAVDLSALATRLELSMPERSMMVLRAGRPGETGTYR